MQLQLQTLQQALSPAFQRQPVIGQQYRQFNYALQQYLAQLRDAESQDEDHIRNIVKGFLEKAVEGTKHYVNPKSFGKGSGIDLAVHNGAKATAPVGVLIEVKQPANKAEMITPQAANRKALHEAIFYYLIEREENHNNEVKHIIVTDGWEWFLFDAQAFHRYFYEDKHLIDQFRKYRAGQLDFRNTGGFYEVIQQVVAGKTETLTATHISLPAYQAYLRQAGYTEMGGTQAHLPLQEAEEPYTEKTEEALTLLQKALSAQHLLKQPLENDSNSLNKAFYEELLYIMGLEEAKEGNKKVIQLDQDGSEGSLMALTMNQLDSEELVDQDGMEAYGADRQERLFQVALQLNITWLNRILFLKLLEAQLISYHQGDQQRFGFMKPGNLKDFDELNTLFVKVLAKKPEDRTPTLAERYADVPYLNSSLFELTPLEKATIRISNLEDQAKMPCMAKSVLKPDNKQGQATQTFPTLEYLLRFLDAYDFGAEGYQRVKQDHKPLISASVLGLVFEKINGYREGSFFTPGFITMYMARETLRKTVLDKFSEQYHLSCDTLAELSNAIRQQQIKPKDANAVINNLKICDPAVGSGHFLVSVLNELIAIKSELGILTDYHGQLLDRYEVTVSNDELEVTDDDHQRFQYTVSWDAQTGQRQVNKETQRLQQALFHEKQQLIENCLFGVDLNTNSVQICRLRLWIELLKNAYYRADENYQRLETLPNIDINIKEGNALVSKFAQDLSDIDKQVVKAKVKEYKVVTNQYKEVTNPERKKGLNKQIRQLKEELEQYAIPQDEDLKKYKKKERELKAQVAQLGEGQQALVAQTSQEFTDLEKKVREKYQTVYKNAVEWPLEFPEVVNEEGTFEGFDVVIGNPPYIRHEEIKALKTYLKANYEVFASTADILTYFIELSVNILKKHGILKFIISNKFMRASYGQKLRQWLQQYQLEEIIDFGDLPVFEEATTYPCIISLSKHAPKQHFKGANVSTLTFENTNDHLRAIEFESDQQKLMNDGWALTDSKSQEILLKIIAQGSPLKEYLNDKIFYGIKTGLNEAFVVNKDKKEQLIEEDPNSSELLKPLLKGRDIKRYTAPNSTKYLILAQSGIDIENYPAIYNHLLQFKIQLKKKAGGNNWYELQASPGDVKKFENPKIMYPDISKNLNFLFDNKGHYCLNTVYNIPTSDKALLGYLNSSVFKFYFQNVANSIRGGYFRFFSEYMNEAPVPEGVSSLADIVEEIIEIKAKNSRGSTESLENEIDEKVCELYGLTEEEVGIVKQFSS